MMKHQLSISNMHCASCVGTVAEQQHYRALLRKSLFAMVIGVSLFIDLFWHWLPPVNVPHLQWPWIMVGTVGFFVLYFSGGHIFKNAWKSFWHHNANMDTLVAMWTGIAWLYSMVIVLIPHIIPSIARHVY